MKHLRNRLPRSKAETFLRSLPPISGGRFLLYAPADDRSDCVLRPLVSEKILGDRNDKREFILIPESAPSDASLRIRACETEWDHASRQASDLKCDDAGGYWSVACRIHYFRPRGRGGYSQSCSTSFAGNCPPSPA